MNPLHNFRDTLSELKAYLALPIQNDRDKAGVIQAFEFTFEQSWKAIQKVAGETGVTLANPKSAFIFAMQNGWIDPSSEPQWLELLKDRNLTTHTYQRKLANEVLSRIQRDYVNMFQGLLSHLENFQAKNA